MSVLKEFFDENHQPIPQLPEEANTMGVGDWAYSDDFGDRVSVRAYYRLDADGDMIYPAAFYERRTVFAGTQYTD